jgi:hypothetical protein
VCARDRTDSAREFVIGHSQRQLCVGTGKSELPMLDTLRADQSIGQFFYFSGPAAKNDHLKAVIVVEVDMQSGDDQVLKVVLGLDQLVVVST